MPHNEIEHQLAERVKELTALHRTARLLQDHGRPDEELMADIVALLPGAWQYPDAAAARIRYRGREYCSPGFSETAWTQRSPFGTEVGSPGDVAVAYLVACPDAAEGPFLAEERELVDSLADMLGAHLARRLADEALRAAHQSLAELVDERTADLRRLASEVTLTEARQRRAIASDLHDHVGQALAHMKQRVRLLQGNAVFSGHADDFAEILRLLDMTIAYTRSLTIQISPPVLYELGLQPALEALADSLGQRRRFPVQVRTAGAPRALPEACQVFLYQSVAELLANSLQHSGAGSATVAIRWSDQDLTVTVSDDGRGFDPAALRRCQPSGGFGLFSVRERIKDLGGAVSVTSAPGAGCRVLLSVPLSAPGEP
jgi:two-component system NarL family sensor kinase